VLVLWFVVAAVAATNQAFLVTLVALALILGTGAVAEATQAPVAARRPQPATRRRTRVSRARRLENAVPR
jgi:hypothetical protein